MAQLIDLRDLGPSRCASWGRWPPCFALTDELAPFSAALAIKGAGEGLHRITVAPVVAQKDFVGRRLRFHPGHLVMRKRMEKQRGRQFQEPGRKPSGRDGVPIEEAESPAKQMQLSYAFMPYA